LPIYTGSALYAPRVAQQLTSERAAEESQMKQRYQQQLATAEAQARAKYSQDLAAKITEIRLKHATAVEAEKAKIDLVGQIATASAQEKKKFEQSVAAQRATIEKEYKERIIGTRQIFTKKMKAGIQEAKRQAAMREKTYKQITPRILRAYKKTELGILETTITAEAEVFKEEMKTWEKRAIGKFETGLEEWKVEELAKQKKATEEWEKAEKAELEKEIAVYKEAAVEQLGLDIKEWKAEEAAKLEPQLVKWREEWQPKGIAERILEWKAPDLPTLDIELFRFKVKEGELRVGFDVGKFAEGLMEGSAAAVAGVVAAGESLAYSVAGLAGVKAPKPPPTFVGGLVSSAIVSIGAGELKPSPQLEELSKKPYAFTYGAATVLGDLLLMYGIGKVAQKAVIEPISKTRIGTAIGFQFKAHAPKLALRVVYGKKGAAYIVAERARLLGKELIVSPTGQVIQFPTGDSKLFREIMTTPSAGLRADFPLKVTRGARITPMKTTLAKALGTFKEAERGIAQILAPLQTVKHIVRPEIPLAALEFGYVPFGVGVSEAIGLGAVLGLKVAAEVKAAAVVKPTIKEIQRLRPTQKEKIIPVVGLAEVVSLAPLQEQAPVQAAAQIQKSALLQIQTLQLQLQLRKPMLQMEKVRKKKKKVIDIWEKRGALFEYPVRKEKEVPSFILGRLPRKTTRRKVKGMNLSKAIFGERKRRKKK